MSATPLDIDALLSEFTRAACSRNGAAFARLFTEDAVYHDVFYGEFRGWERIAALIDDWFFRTADEFRWVMLDPVSNGTTLYARYTFSYRSKLAEAGGARVLFEGVGIFTLRHGLIAEYREVADVGPAFVQLGFAPERIATILRRSAATLRASLEGEPHL